MLQLNIHHQRECRTERYKHSDQIQKTSKYHPLLWSPSRISLTCTLNITGEDGEIEEGKVTTLRNKLDALHKMISMSELKAVWGGRWGKCWLLMIQRSCQVRLRKRRDMHHGAPWHRTQKET